MLKIRGSGVSDQRKVAIHRQQDARELQNSGRWRGAMYLLGYAVECGLKARLMERHGLVNLEELQRYLARRLGRKIDVFTHSLHLLMEWTFAGNRITREQRTSWGIVRTWRVEWRYDPDAASQQECHSFFEACQTAMRFIQRSL